LPKASTIVGYYGGGFLYSGGTYTTLNDPLATGTNTFAYGINNASQIVGYYGGGETVATTVSSTAATSIPTSITPRLRTTRIPKALTI
jgi:hypothetical protein